MSEIIVSSGEVVVNGEQPWKRNDQSKLTDEQFATIVNGLANNLTFSRLQLTQLFSDDFRNIEAECGYPNSAQDIPATKYLQLYDRDPLAAKIVDKMPEICWQVVPEIYESEELEEEDENEEALDEEEIPDDAGNPPGMPRAGLAGFGGPPKPPGFARNALPTVQPTVQPSTGAAQTNGEPPEPATDGELDEASEAPEGGSAFEEAFKQIGRDLGGAGYYEGEEGHPIWEYCERADKRSRIGRYGIILVGIKGSGSLETPLDLADVEMKTTEEVVGEDEEGEDVTRTKVEFSSRTEEGQENLKELKKLIYLRVLDETQAPIIKWVSDPDSERFGKPEFYSVTISGGNDIIQVPGSTDGGDGAQTEVATTTTIKVHHTRVIHLAECLGNNESLAIPILQRVYNRLYDLHKLYGGSAEMFYQGAFGGISLETHPTLGGQVDVDIADIRRALEQRRRGLQRDLAIPGFTANSLAPQIADPSNHIDRQIEAICAFTEIPKRVLLGSERGELASSQDMRGLFATAKKRQNRYITPKVVVPLVNLLIRAGVLPVPQQFYCDWPDIASLTDLEKADVSLKRTQALAAYMTGDVSQILELRDYLVREMYYTEEEADMVIRNRRKAMMSAPEVDVHAREDMQAAQQMQVDAERFEIEREDNKEMMEAKLKADAAKAKAGASGAGNAPPFKAKAV